MTVLRISQLAEHSGVPATTLRFYETQGLLPADRTPSGYRVYGDEAVARLEFIGAAKQLGLSLEEIGELLAVWESGACAEVKADLRPRLSVRLDEARRCLAELTVFADSLRIARDRLEALPDRADPCDSACGFHTPPSSPSSLSSPSAPWWPIDCGGAPRTAPVACSLTGGETIERTAQWHKAVEGAVRVEIPGGLRLTLPVARTASVAALAAAEQACCPFFDFRLRLEGPELHLEVRAPAEGAALLADLFDGAAAEQGPKRT